MLLRGVTFCCTQQHKLTFKQQVADDSSANDNFSG